MIVHRWKYWSISFISADAEPLSKPYNVVCTSLNYWIARKGFVHLAYLSFQIAWNKKDAPPLKMGNIKI